MLEPLLAHTQLVWLAMAVLATAMGLSRRWRGGTAWLATSLWALCLGDWAGNWMARHSVNNLWLDRLQLALVSGLNLNFLGVRPRVRHWTLLALGLLASALLYPADKFGVVVPLTVLSVSSWGLYSNLRDRLQGTCSEPVWLFTGTLAWAWTLVLRVFADHAASMTRGQFAAYWAVQVLWGFAAMGMITYGTWASRHRSS